MPLGVSGRTGNGDSPAAAERAASVPSWHVQQLPAGGIVSSPKFSFVLFITVRKFFCRREKVRWNWNSPTSWRMERKLRAETFRGMDRWSHRKNSWTPATEITTFSNSNSNKLVLGEGTWNHWAVELVQEIGRRATLITGEPRESTFLFQQLSIALRRGNAVIFLNSFDSN